jgi:hypothetical protein
LSVQVTIFIIKQGAMLDFSINFLRLFVKIFEFFFCYVFQIHSCYEHTQGARTI